MACADTVLALTASFRRGTCCCSWLPAACWCPAVQRCGVAGAPVQAQRGEGGPCYAFTSQWSRTGQSADWQQPSRRHCEGQLLQPTLCNRVQVSRRFGRQVLAACKSVLGPGSSWGHDLLGLGVWAHCGLNHDGGATRHGLSPTTEWSV